MEQCFSHALIAMMACEILTAMISTSVAIKDESLAWSSVAKVNCSEISQSSDNAMVSASDFAYGSFEGQLRRCRLNW